MFYSSPETWFSVALTLAAAVEAWALVKIYQLERKQEEARSRIEVFVDMFVEPSVTMTITGKTLRLTVANLSESAIHISTLSISAQIQGTENDLRFGRSWTVAPHSYVEVEHAAVKVKDLLHAMEKYSNQAEIDLRVTTEFFARGKTILQVDGPYRAKAHEAWVQNIERLCVRPGPGRPLRSRFIQGWRFWARKGGS